MKDKVLIVKVDDEFTEKVDYLQRINDYKNRSDTVRKTIEKEFQRELMVLPKTYYVENGVVYTEASIEEREEGRCQ